MPPEWSITLRDAAGEPLAHVTVCGTEVSVEPSEAQDHPFVAASVVELRRSVTRPRHRAACGGEPPSDAGR